MKAEKVHSANSDLGENPTWDHRSQRLFWVDIGPDRLCRWDPATGQADSWDLPEQPGCFALTDDESRVILALRSGAFVLDLDSHAVTPLASAPFDPARFFMNDGHCDRAGVFVVGSHDTQKKHVLDRNSSFYRLVDGEFRHLTPDVGVSNGLAFSPDNKTLYRSEFREGLILAYDYDSAAGVASNRRTFATIPEGMGVPDGATVDAEGGYWVALMNGGCVVRFTEDGTLDREVKIDARQATMLSFGGPDLRTVYITSANRPSAELSDVGRNPGGLFAFRSEIPGLPETFVKL